jgi:CRISPR/Cas system CMR-associated protein Cmr5 small subunit
MQKVSNRPKQMSGNKIIRHIWKNVAKRLKNIETSKRILRNKYSRTSLAFKIYANRLNNCAKFGTRNASIMMRNKEKQRI